MKKLEKLIKNYPLYVGLIFLTFFFKEFFPFTFYPMYNNFPNWSYTFYLEDAHGNNITEDFKISHGDLMFLLEAESKSKKVGFGNNAETMEELQEIGNTVIKDIYSKVQPDIKEVNLVRIYNHLESDVIISDTSIIAHIEMKAK